MQAGGLGSPCVTSFVMEIPTFPSLSGSALRFPPTSVGEEGGLVDGMVDVVDMVDGGWSIGDAPRTTLLVVVVAVVEIGDIGGLGVDDVVVIGSMGVGDATVVVVVVVSVGAAEADVVGEEEEEVVVVVVVVVAVVVDAVSGSVVSS